MAGKDRSIETIASVKQAKEQIQAKSNMPAQLLDSAEAMVELLEEYYRFMNMKDFVYSDEEVEFEATVIDGSVVFKSGRNQFFFDDEYAYTKIIDPVGDQVTPPSNQTFISNGNELPAPLLLDNESYGRQFIVNGLEAYENRTLKLITNIVVYAGNQPSRVFADMKRIRNIENAPDSFVDKLHSEYATAIPRQLSVDRVLLYKNLVQFYRERGSQESIEVFFKILVGDLVQIYYPKEDMLTPSSGTWDPDINVPVYDNNGTFIEFKKGKYLDRNGFISDIKKLQDSFFYQKYSYVIRTGTNVEKWRDTFNKLIHPAGFTFFGEIAILIEMLNQRNSIMPDNQPGFIGAEDLPLLITLFSSLPEPTFLTEVQSGSVSNVNVITGGFRYNTAPTVVFSAPDLVDGVRATGTATIDSRGRVTGINITNSGSGYVNRPSIDLIGRRDRVAEVLPILIIAVKNRDRDYLKTLAERWWMLTKFFDNTSMYAYDQYDLESLADGSQAVYTNVGTEVFEQTIMTSPTISQTNDKLQTGYL